MAYKSTFDFMRGSTPLIKYTIPSTFDLSQVTALNIVLVQDDKIQVEKNLQGVTISGQEISFRLTQQQTLSLDESKPVYTQIKFKVGNTVIPTNIIKLTVEDILNEEVM